MVVKCKVVSKHLDDLGSIFEVLRRHKLGLNASKCSFGVSIGKFLGYVVTHRGIILIRLKRSMIYSLLGILKRCKR